MNFDDLKSIDVGAKLKGLMSNRSALLQGPFAKTILWSVLGGLVLVVYVFFVFWPGVEQRQMMAQKVDAIPEMEARVTLLDISIRKAEDDLLQAEQSYADLNQLFSVESELEELYQRLSAMASSQGLVISALTKDGEEAIYGASKPVGATPTAGATANNAPAPASGNTAKAGPPPTPLFYRIKLKVDLNGQFTHYLNFRKLLAEFDKSINIDKEQISLIPGDNRGMVLVKAQLSTFRLPNKLNTKPAAPIKPLSSLESHYPRGDFFDDDMRYIKVSAVEASDPLTSAPAEAPLSNPFRGPNAAGTMSAESKAAPNVNASPKSAMPASSGVNPSAYPRPGRSAERDPFARSSSGMIEGGRDPRLSPLLMAPPESYVITGVIVSSGVKAAMIRTDFRENFVVRVGDRLGNQGGVISEIDMDGIVVRQGGQKIRLYVQLQTGPQYLGPGAGGGR